MCMNRCVPRTGSVLCPLLSALHQSAEERRVLWGQVWEWDGSPGAGNWTLTPRDESPQRGCMWALGPAGFLGCVATSFCA